MVWNTKKKKKKEALTFKKKCRGNEVFPLGSLVDLIIKSVYERLTREKWKSLKTNLWLPTGSCEGEG